MKKIVIVSSGQPSANPRLVKEAIVLSRAGYKIKVLYCPFSPWADEYDQNLFQLHPEIEWIKVGYHPVKERFRYLYARFRQKCYGLFYKLFGNQSDAGLRSMVLFSKELIQEAKRNQADLFIGHNLGALPAVAKAAAYHSAQAGFDFEDFHRGEDKEHSIHWKKTKQTEERYIPLLNFATAASPLITKEYQTIFKGLFCTTINNCFPLSYAANDVKSLPTQPLKLFWFSQTIGEKRGLETVIEAMGKLDKGQVELSLLGNCSAKNKNYFQAVAKKNGLAIDQLKFLPAVEEKKIITIAASHHIGLASEVPHIQNRDICLTNKVFMYLLAGNAVAFSNTKSQSLFLLEHPGIGVVYEQNDAEHLATLLKRYIHEPALLQQHRMASLQLGTGFLNWEKEQQGLLQKVKEVLH